MNKISKISLAIASTILLMSCEKDTITASEDITTKDHEISGYSALEVNDNFKVYINFSDTAGQEPLPNRLVALGGRGSQ